MRHRKSLSSELGNMQIIIILIHSFKVLLTPMKPYVLSSKKKN